jgi:CRP-like cAMP-binding protein
MSLDRDMALLSKVPLFSELGNEHLRLLAFSAVRTELLVDQMLFREGSPATSGYVVASGELEMSTGQGRHRQAIGKCEPGSLIGEIALFVETRRPATATAVKHSEVLEINRAMVVRMLNEYPHVALRLRATLAERLRVTVGELNRVRQSLSRIDQGKLV